MSKGKLTEFTPPIADDLAAKMNTDLPTAPGTNNGEQHEEAGGKTLPEQYEERRVQIINELTSRRVETEKRMRANHEGIKVARAEMFRAAENQAHGKVADIQSKIQQAASAIRADERLIVELEAQRVQVASGNHPELHRISAMMTHNEQSLRVDALQKAQAEFLDALNSPEFMKAARAYVETFQSVHPLESNDALIRFEAYPFIQKNVTLARLVLAAAE